MVFNPDGIQPEERKDESGIVPTPDWVRKLQESAKSKKQGPPKPRVVRKESMEKLKEELEGPRRRELKRAFMSEQFGNTDAKEVGEDREDERVVELVKTFRKDFETGRAAYSINTKIAKGKKFKGEEGKREKNNYIQFYETGKLKKLTGFTVKKKLGSDTAGAAYKIFEEIGDTILFLAPAKRSGREAILKDFGTTGRGENEKMCDLAIRYQDDSSKFYDERGLLVTDVEFQIRMDLARQILEEIEKDPQSLWKFLDSIEPDLLNAAPRRNDFSFRDKRGLVVYENGSMVNSYEDFFDAINYQVLPWDKKEN